MGNGFVIWFSRWYKGIIIGLAGFGVVMLVVLAMQHVNGAAAAGRTAGPIPTFTSTARGIGPLKVPDHASVLVVGDSYADGTGASSEDTRWANVLAKKEGWTLTVDAVGGTGFTWGGGTDGTDGEDFGTRLAALTKKPDVKPDLVILEGGQNDSRAENGELSKAVATTVKAAKSAWPDADVIVLGPAAPEPLATSIARLDEAVQSGALTAGAYSVNPRNGRWFTTANSPGFMFNPAHVNDGGHALIAEKMSEAIDLFRSGERVSY